MKQKLTAALHELNKQSRGAKLGQYYRIIFPKMRRISEVLRNRYDIHVDGISVYSVR